MTLWPVLFTMSPGPAQLQAYSRLFSKHLFSALMNEKWGIASITFPLVNTSPLKSHSRVLDAPEGGREVRMVLPLYCCIIRRLLGPCPMPKAFERVVNLSPSSKSLNLVLLWIPSSILGLSWVKCHSAPRCSRGFSLGRDPSIPTLATSECLINQLAEKYLNSS